MCFLNFPSRFAFSSLICNINQLEVGEDHLGMCWVVGKNLDFELDCWKFINQLKQLSCPKVQTVDYDTMAHNQMLVDVSIQNSFLPMAGVELIQNECPRLKSSSQQTNELWISLYSQDLVQVEASFLIITINKLSEFPFLFFKLGSHVTL